MKNFILFNLCALIIYAPLPLGANRIWASSTIEIWIFALFSAHLYLVLRNRKRLSLPKYSRPIFWPLVITLAWLSLQLTPGLGHLLGRAISTLSYDPTLSHIMLLKTLAFTLFAWLVFSYVKCQGTLRKLAMAIVISGLFQAAYAAYLNLTPGMTSLIFDVPYAKRAQGSFMYHNQLANYLALTLSIGIGLLVSQLSLSSSGENFRHKARGVALTLLSAKMLLRLCLIIMIISLILTRSRMGNSAFFMALAAISIYAFFFYNKKPKNLRLLILSFFILDLILVGTIFGLEKVKQRLVETSLQSETRDEVVRDSMAIIEQHPIFGTGGGSFYSTFPSYHPQPYSGFYDHAHNDYIQFTVELGIPITLMLGIMLLYCLYISLKTMAQRKTPLYQGVSFGCAMAIIHMILHSTVDFSLQSPAIALLFISILSLSLIAANIKTSKESN